MKEFYIIKSKKTLKQIEQIKNDLQSYRENIASLHDDTEGKMEVSGDDYCDKAAHYRRSEVEDQRYFWTLKNIKIQMAFLEYELKVLSKYGT